MYQFNPYAIPPFFTAIFLFALGFFVFIKNIRLMPNIAFGLLSLSSAIWQFGFGMEYLSIKEETALFWNRFVYLGVPFIVPTMYHFSVSFPGFKEQKRFVILSYILAAIFVLLSRTDYFITGLRKYFWGYYTNPGILHHPFLIIWFSLGIVSIINLYKGYKNINSALERRRRKYMFLALIISLIGTLDYLPAYGLQLYPFGYLPVVICLSLIAYAILKYSVMDVSVTITRTGIFIGVYTLVLGLPFLLGVFGKNTLINLWGENWWLGPLALIAVLATAGPFAYIYFQKRAEAILLREQRKYQEILRQTAMGMTRIRNPRQLLNLIVDILIKNVHITHSAVYLPDAGYTQFIMRSCRNFKKGQADSISAKSKLLPWLENNKKPLLHDEISRKAQDETGAEQAFKKIEEEMRLLNAVVVVPGFLEDKLVSIITLGEKNSGRIYTAEDLNIFSILAGQAALAIENASLYDNIERKVKERTRELVEVQKQLVQAEKLATVGTLAGGVAHEINNPLTAILTSVQMLLASGGKIDAEFDRESLELIEEATKRCRTIVQKLMVYARKPLETSDISNVDLLEVIKNVDSFLNYQLAQDNVKISINAPDDKYLVMGNRNELEQVVTNMILNARDAITQAKKLGQVNISLLKDDGKINLRITDDGCGIPENILHKIFDPFFTTKDVGKGLGLGLSICQSIIEKHNGSVSVQSEANKGTTFTIELPRSEIQVEVKSGV